MLSPYPRFSATMPRCFHCSRFHSRQSHHSPPRNEKRKEEIWVLKTRNPRRRCLSTVVFLLKEGFEGPCLSEPNIEGPQSWSCQQGKNIVRSIHPPIIQAAQVANQHAPNTKRHQKNRGKTKPNPKMVEH